MHQDVTNETERLAATSAAGRSAASDREAPRLADGIELIGEFEGSGYKEDPYLARREDGQVIQLTELLYLVAEQCDGSRSLTEIADAVSDRWEKRVSADNVRFLVDKKLRPLGVLTAADGSSPQVEKLSPLLALRFRMAITSETVTNRVTGLFKPLFLPPVVIAVVVGFAAMLGWLFLVHGIAQSTRELLYQPPLMLLVLGLTVLSAGFHEFGHAAACRYGGATPGVMGCGVYLVWPAFYTDVTDAYRLGKAGRLRTDLGGVYFNIVFSLVTFGVWALTQFEPLLLLIPIQLLQMVHQLLPFLRMDGYYILADLTGVPDLFTRIKPVLTSLLPWKQADDRVKQLQPWVRVVVTLWVLTVVPLLLYTFLTIAVSAPRIFATAWDSFGQQVDKVSKAFGDGDALGAIAGVLSTIFLVLPILGIVYSFVRLGKKVLSSGWERTEGRPIARTGFVALCLAGLGTLLYVWLPNGDYEPIRRGEKGTIQGSLAAVSRLPSGRPGLTPVAQRQAAEDSGTVEEDDDRSSSTTTSAPATTTTTARRDDDDTTVTTASRVTTTTTTVRSTTTTTTVRSTTTTTTTADTTETTTEP
jgi:putative peptide zinc metalloprotease protein